MDLIQRLCEEKIKKAQKEGQFDALSGAGKPLLPEDLSHIPEDVRAGYLLLKNAGYLPEEMELKKEILRLEDLIKACTDETEQEQLQARMNYKLLQFHQIMEKRGHTKSASLRKYRSRLQNRIR